MNMQSTSSLKVSLHLDETTLWQWSSWSQEGMEGFGNYSPLFFSFVNACAAEKWESLFFKFLNKFNMQFQKIKYFIKRKFHTTYSIMVSLPQPLSTLLPNSPNSTFPFFPYLSRKLTGKQTKSNPQFKKKKTER